MADRGTVFMETTEIPVERTAGEITSLLVKNGARKIRIEYDQAGAPVGVEFDLQIEGLPLPFRYRLAVQTDALFKAFQKRRANPNNRYSGPEYEAKDRAHGQRTAWRQLFRWLEAQFALVTAGMAKPQQLLLPFVLDATGAQTLFEYFETTGYKQLGAGGPK